MRLMKALAISATLIAAAPTVAFTPGCSILQENAHPTAVYQDWQQVYVSTVELLIIAFDEGKISQSDWDNFYNPAIQEGDRLLDVMYEELENPDKFDLARESLVSVINIIKNGIE